MTSTYTADFSGIRMGNIARVGGKNGSLGEMFARLKSKEAEIQEESPPCWAQATLMESPPRQSEERQ